MSSELVPDPAGPAKEFPWPTEAEARQEMLNLLAFVLREQPEDLAAVKATTPDDMQGLATFGLCTAVLALREELIAWANAEMAVAHG